MTSLGSRLGLAVVMAGLAARQRVGRDPGRASRTGAAPGHPPRSAAADADLSARPGRRAGPRFDGRVGIAVRSVNDGWQTGWKADELYPQQSVSKLWVSIAALDAVDKGRVRLDDKVTLTRSDLTLFHQPIAAMILGGGYTTSLADLMFKAITTSDNTCNDKLMRSIGGPAAVRGDDRREGTGRDPLLRRRARAAEQDRRPDLVAKLFGRQRLLLGPQRACLFRSARPSFDRYVEDPYDGAAPSAIVSALSRLKRGEILSPASTARILSIMGHTKTGANRLKGGLEAGLDA